MGCSKCHGEPKGNKPCGACGKLPPVIEIRNEECPILFHTVEVEGSSDDKPPYIGQYRNALVVYKENGAKYLFSSDGVPSALTGDIDFDTLVHRPKYAGQQMTGDTNIPDVDAAVAELENSLAPVAKSGKYTDLTDTPVIDTSLDKTSTNAVTNKAIATAIEEITTEIDRPVVYDLEMTSDADSVTFTEDKIDVVTGEVTQEVDTIPTASSTTAGTISAAEFNSITDSQEKLEALENGSVALNNIPAAPTQQQLTTAWLTATGRDTLINRASIYDIDNTKVWTYYTNISTWEEVTAGTISVNPFTNSVAGTILGSTNEGSVSANVDGTGSVSGWSNLVNNVSYIDSTIGTISNDAYVGTNNIQDGAVTTPKIADGAVTGTKLGAACPVVSDVLSTPSSVAYVATGNIQDGAVTAAKIDWSTTVTQLFSGDVTDNTITLSQDARNFEYLIFEIQSRLNDRTSSIVKIPVRTSEANYRYTLAQTGMSANGATFTDCTQFTMASNGLALNVKYTGYTVINANNTVNTSTTSRLHVLGVYGTNCLI